MVLWVNNSKLYALNWKYNYLCLYYPQGRGALQDIDQMALFKPLCKLCATVSHVRDIVPTLRKALQAAQSGTPGIAQLPHKSMKILTYNYVQ